jgi:hypothetical protein
MIDYREIKFEEAVEHHLIHHGYSKADSKNFDRALTCISHRTLRVALWRRLFSLPRRLSSRRMSRHECRDGSLRGCAANSLRRVD